MKYRERGQCLINGREVQIALIMGVISLILNRFYPQIQVLRLTPPSLPRQFFLTLEPAIIVGIIAACIVGPWAGLIIAMFAPNPQFIPEVGIIISAVQFITIGYAHRKIQSPWNILAIPLGTVMILIIHPTIVGYILFRQVFVYLFLGTNMLFQTIVSLGVYLLVQFFVPHLFEWTNPGVEYKFRLWRINHNKLAKKLEICHRDMFQYLIREPFSGDARARKI